ncbi:type VI secretion system contractile sheath large subunit [Chondromyces crocatus]|uniref:Type VI secretion protein EvpB n=1 Tax=Chondromyces crocatus TaxID=52 RepID=A0A0K1ERH4_CHOCO|nr:type VI secretion system contractile sheath large subunit [Chondromyces crocatus]AKT43530.1 type VI secretion protein EvpB [Chondromyces crocatus]
MEAQPAEATPEVPRTMLEEILASSRLPPGHEDYDAVGRGVRAVVGDVVRRRGADEKIDNALVDQIIAEIDAGLSRQIDEILHHPAVQRLEAAWRALKFVIDRVEFRENIRVELLNCSKEDLLADFEDSPEVVKSGLYKTVYSAEFGVFGGKPFGAIISSYEFGPSPQDIALLQKCASVAAMSHAPFFAAAGPLFFGQKNHLNLPHLGEIKAMFEGPQYIKYNSFRESEDARYVGLLLPRFLLRLPYGPSTMRVRAFAYEEDVVGNHEAFLWGNPAAAFATRLAESFARNRWCLNIVGPNSGGTVEGLVLHQYEAMGAIQTKIPVEVLLTERREFELAEEGFIGLAFRKDTTNACFFSANSVQKPKYYGISEEGRTAEMNFRLGTQLPYMFLISRLAHYIKVLQRENIGSWKERQDLEQEINSWLNQYVSDMDVVSPAVRSKRPLRRARVRVTDVAGNAGWYRVDLEVRPHLKYMGAMFNLNIVGKLEKE